MRNHPSIKISARFSPNRAGWNGWDGLNFTRLPARMISRWQLRRASSASTRAVLCGAEGLLRCAMSFRGAKQCIAFIAEISIAGRDFGDGIHRTPSRNDKCAVEMTVTLSAYPDVSSRIVPEINIVRDDTSPLAVSCAA